MSFHLLRAVAMHYCRHSFAFEMRRLGRRLGLVAGMHLKDYLGFLLRFVAAWHGHLTPTPPARSKSWHVATNAAAMLLRDYSYDDLGRGLLERINDAYAPTNQDTFNSSDYADRVTTTSWLPAAASRMLHAIRLCVAITDAFVQLFAAVVTYAANITSADNLSYL